MPIKGGFDDVGPLSTFCNELDTLIVRWRDKPADDRLSFAEFIAALEFKKFQLMLEAQAS